VLNVMLMAGVDRHNMVNFVATPCVQQPGDRSLYPGYFCIEQNQNIGVSMIECVNNNYILWRFIGVCGRG
jgi:hypothetical protein